MEKLGPRVRVRSVKPIEGFKVLVTFDNDTQKEIDECIPGWPIE